MKSLTFYGRLGKFSWRMLAAVLAGEAIVIFFGALVARALASAAGSGSADTFLAVGSGLAVVCLLAAGLMRRPWGVTLGWLLQAAAILTAFVVPTMLVVGLIFLGLWVLVMVQGAKVDALQQDG